MVAIILVNYNGVCDTIECIRSLLCVSGIEYEIIVVDNGSTDDSIVALKKEQLQSRFTLLEVSENKGFSAGNNIGIKYAQEKNAEYYLLLNNDTIVKPDFLQYLLAGFELQNNCGVTTGRIFYYSMQDTIWYAGGSLSPKTGRCVHFEFGQKDENLDVFPKNVSFASGCCMCLSKKIVESVGFLNEDFFLYEEDSEYCYRIIKAGFSIVYMPTSIIYHKVSSSTGQDSPMSQYYMIRNKYNFIRENFKGFFKVCAYIYCTEQLLFRCIKNKVRFRCYIAAFRAFMRKETGKVRKNVL